MADIKALIWGLFLSFYLAVVIFAFFKFAGESDEIRSIDQVLLLALMFLLWLFNQTKTQYVC